MHNLNLLLTLQIEVIILKYLTANTTIYINNFGHKRYILK